MVDRLVVGWVRRFVTAVVSLGLVSGFLWAGGGGLAVAAGSADVRLSVSGPQSSATTLPFDFTVEVSSTGPDAADGTVVSVDQVGATNVVVPSSCTPSGAAVCPTDWVVSGSKLTGTISKLPGNGKLSFHYVGRFPPSGTSVSTVAEVAMPAGVTDPDLRTNKVSQGTQFPEGSFTASKTAELVSKPGVILVAGQVIPAGEQVKWEIVLKNTSSTTATNVKIDDIIHASGSGQKILLVGSIQCSESGGADCPDVWPSIFGDTETGYIWYPWSGVLRIPDMPSGSELRISYVTTHTPVTCGQKSFYNNFQASATNFSGGAVSTPEFQLDSFECSTFAVSKRAELVSKPGVALAEGQVVPAGEQVKWEIVLKNTSSVTARNVRFNDTAYAFGSGQKTVLVGAIQCAKAGGAECPDAWPASSGDTEAEYNFYPWSRASLVVPDMPAGSELTITYVTTHAPITCGQKGFYNTFSASATNFSGGSVYTPLFQLEPFPCSTFTVSKSAELVSKPGVALVAGQLVPAGEQVKWTVVLKNTSTTTATNVKFGDVLYAFGSGQKIALVGSVGCVAVDGAGCPDAWPASSGNTEIGYNFYPWSSSPTIPDMPAGSELRITYVTTHIPVICGEKSFYNTFDARATNFSGGGASTPSYRVGAFDLVGKLGVSPQAMGAGDVVSLDVVLSESCNGGSGVMSLVLPPEQNFEFGGVTPDSVVCTAPAGGICPVFAYDPATRVLSATFDKVLSAPYSVKVVGNAGLVKGVTAPAKLTLSPTLGDMVPSSNTAEVTYGVENQQTTNTISYELSTADAGGVVSVGVPVSVVAEGVLVCEKQGTFPYSVTIPTTGAASWSKVVWNQDTCHVSFGAIDAPVGYRWKTPVSITSADTGGAVVQAADRSIVLTGTLEPIPHGLGVEYQIATPAGQVGVPADLVFGGTLKCTGVADRSWSVTIPKGSGTGAQQIGQAAQGSSCEFVPGAIPAAPVGWVWKTPVTSADAGAQPVTGGRVAHFTGALEKAGAPAVVGSVTGRVCRDTHQLGTCNDDEADISGVTVELVDASGVVVAEATTASPYVFSNVVLGAYTVRVKVTNPVLVGLVATMPTTRVVSVGGVAPVTGVDFGYDRVATPTDPTPPTIPAIPPVTPGQPGGVVVTPSSPADSGVGRPLPRTGANGAGLVGAGLVVTLLLGGWFTTRRVLRKR